VYEDDFKAPPACSNWTSLCLWWPWVQSSLLPRASMQLAFSTGAEEPDSQYPFCGHVKPMEQLTPATILSTSSWDGRVGQARTRSRRSAGTTKPSMHCIQHHICQAEMRAYVCSFEHIACDERPEGEALLAEGEYPARQQVLAL
jgi:hypothetical protein